MYLPRLAFLLWLPAYFCPALGWHAPPLRVALRRQRDVEGQEELSSEQEVEERSEEELLWEQHTAHLRRGRSAPVPEGLIMREAKVWLMALDEAKLDMYNISSFGRSVGKIPGSWVEKVNALDHTKHRAYNFQGSYFAHDVKKYREWVSNFAKEHFSEHDFLRFTDPPKTYVPMGSFDKTNTPGGFRPKDHSWKPEWTEMKPEYFEILLGSNFTLCPRGDRAFSYRFYESALAYSIPVVSSLRRDLAETVPVMRGKVYPQRLRCIGYHYYSLEELNGNMSRLEYRRDWAEENYKLFIRYQTFLEGDNVPPKCPPTLF